MYDSKIDLRASVREKVMPLLQARLADAVDLYTQVKQAHWNVKGPSFIALHELFDKLAAQIAEHADLLAERITALAGRADGTARVAAATSGIEEYPTHITEGMQHCAVVAARLATFGKAVRACIERAAEAGDAGTADLFTEISREIDKQLWFVEAHIRPGSADERSISVRQAS